MTNGYAIVDHDNKILVNTVSETKRAAKVNYLVAHCNKFVSNNFSDEWIENMFDQMAKVHNSRIALIGIYEVKETTT